jgi:hypothetical protein
MKERTMVVVSLVNAHLTVISKSVIYEVVSISFRTVAWSENCKWYSSLPLGAVVSLFYESV